ncbi:MAG: EVE domain-containing protein [Proteobacteria bacterium]|nr:MAG: EVE domain-containing protein [Pseudomonadota bacterium]
MKSEPNVFSFDDLLAEPEQTTYWEGVRNYQARNMMRDQMKVGDQVFYYHSSCDEPGIYGLAEIVREGYPDPTAFEPTARYFDPKSEADAPRWYMVDLKAIRPLSRPILLAELRDHADELEGLALLRKGNRLSVLPVDPRHWQIILDLE